MTQPCLFFDKLPAEIRNHIYDLSFTTEQDYDDVHLFKAKPPTKSLLLTCRQAYGEAKCIYNESYRKYWSTNKFFLDEEMVVLSGSDSMFRRHALASFGNAEIEHISYLSLEFHMRSNEMLELKLLDPGGAWSWVFPGEDERLCTVAALGEYGFTHIEWRSLEEMRNELEQATSRMSLKDQIEQTIWIMSSCS